MDGEWVSRLRLTKIYFSVYLENGYMKAEKCGHKTLQRPGEQNWKVPHMVLCLLAQTHTHTQPRLLGGVSD